MSVVHLPQSLGDSRVSMETLSVVLVGANGSGKSRMGIWIEENQPKGVETHRIAAQRALTFQDRIAPRPFEDAKLQYQFGWSPTNRPDLSWDEALAQSREQRKNNRWGRRPASHLLNDYDHVLSLLRSLENKANADLKGRLRDGPLYPEDVSPSEQDKALQIWSEVMPQRALAIQDDRLLASLAQETQYSAIDMSDGERVAFYLIAQSMCAPPNAVIIVDEPELHLHRSIQSALWDAIERERQDCVFVYITHDLEFAASRSNARKVWIKSYDGESWEWDVVSDVDGFPSNLLLQIVGCRKPVLFVEGQIDSIDSQLYRRIYPHHSIVPREGCAKVIEATRALRLADGFHGVAAFGLIDRDHRSDDELNALAREGVFATPVAEAETVFCMPCVVEAACEHEGKQADDVLPKIAKQVLREFDNDLERQTLDRARHEVHFQLGKFDGHAEPKKESFVEAVECFKAEVDAGAIHDQARATLEAAKSKADYADILRVFNRKGLVSQVCALTGKTVEHYPTWVLTELDQAEALSNPSLIGKKMLVELRKCFPSIPLSVR